MEKRILTEEVRNKLLGVLPFSANATILYTPKSIKSLDIPEDTKAVFTVRGFNKAEKDEVITKLKNLSNVSYEDIIKTIKPCVTGMVNMFDAGTMEEIVFKHDFDNTISMEILSQLPKTIIDSIFNYLIKISGIMDVDKLGLDY